MSFRLLRAPSGSEASCNSNERAKVLRSFGAPRGNPDSTLVLTRSKNGAPQRCHPELVEGRGARRARLGAPSK